MGWFLWSFQCRSPNFMKFVWKSYLLPIIDYASQMWSPHRGVLLTKLENLLKSFTEKIEWFQNLHYWDRLSALKIPSIARRFERYKILYVWKTVTGNVDNCGLTWNCTDTAGTTINTIRTKRFMAREREDSFQYLGPRLFNSLPRYLRDNTGATQDEWKSLLDEFLSNIPDLPVTNETMPGLCDPLTARASNSIIHWIPFMYLDSRRGRKDNRHKHFTVDEAVSWMCSGSSWRRSSSSRFILVLVLKFYSLTLSGAKL